MSVCELRPNCSISWNTCWSKAWILGFPWGTLTTARRRWWWQIPVVCCQTYLSQAPSWLLVLAHTSGSPRDGTDAGSDATCSCCHSLFLTHEYLCTFIWSRRASRGLTRDTHPGNVCAQGLRHPLRQWETPAPHELARGCKPAPLEAPAAPPHPAWAWATSARAASPNAPLPPWTASTTCWTYARVGEVARMM